MIKFVGNKMLLKELCNTLLELKKYGRAVESNADALIPLADNEITRDSLDKMSKAGQTIATEAAAMYKSLAREAHSE